MCYHIPTMVSLIVAYERSRGIGKGHDLLWGPYEMSSDMARVREVTRSCGTVIIGTGALINEQVDLSKRPYPKIAKLIVLTRRPKDEITIPDVEVANSVSEALEMAQHNAVVLGGVQVYHSALPYVDVIYATEVDADLPHDDDKKFPELNMSEWQEVERTFVPVGHNNPDKPHHQDIYPSYQVTYRRKK